MTLTDGRRLSDCAVLGTDAFSDLAVVRLSSPLKDPLDQDLSLGIDGVADKLDEDLADEMARGEADKAGEAGATALVS